MGNRTILEIFLLTGFVVSSCGWVYIHYKYVFKPMCEQNKILHDKIVKEREEYEKAKQLLLEEHRLTSEYFKKQIEKNK